MQLCSSRSRQLSSSTRPVCSPSMASCGRLSARSVSRTHASGSSTYVPQPMQQHEEEEQQQQQQQQWGRRAALALLSAGPALLLQPADQAGAVQGLTAGRIPGLSSAPDADGFFTYTRPEGKSGGHGVGWSELPRYSFKVPEGWAETPVSIADLGGTEIDLRFASASQGNLEVVVAPVLRFADIGFNADVRIEQLNKPDAIIAGFAPELFGRPLNDDDVVSTRVVSKQGVTFYEYELRPHSLVSATAVGNRVFILSVVAKSSRTWQKTADTLRAIQQSFFVPPPARGSGSGAA